MFAGTTRTASSPPWPIVAAAIVVAVVALVLIARLYVRGRQGQAMVRTGFGRTVVAFHGMFVVPGLHRLRWVDLMLHTVEVIYRGEMSLLAADGLATELRVAFTVHVGSELTDILAAVEDCDGDRGLLVDSVAPTLDEAVRQTVQQFSRSELFGLEHQVDVKRRILHEVEGCLGHGVVVDGIAMEYFEPVQEGQLSADDSPGRHGNIGKS